MMNRINAINMKRLLVVLVICCAGAFGSPAASSDDAAQTLALLCKGKATPLTRLSQVTQLIAHIKTLGDASAQDCAELRAALLDLEPIVSEHTEDVCTPHKVHQMREYHLKHILGDGKQQLPKTLRDFYVALGLRVSSICKKNMINNLLYDTEQRLSDKDREMMRSLASKEQNMMDKIMGGPRDYDDIMLISEMNKLAGGDDDDDEQDASANDDDKVFIQTATGKTIRRIQVACERRFRPFYERLVLPLVTLSNLGYNYQGEDLERELEEMRNNKQVHEWYKIVYLCESLRNVGIVEEADDAQRTEGLDQRLVRVLTAQEAEARMSSAPQQVCDATRCYKDAAEAEFEQITYAPESGNPLGDDEVLDASDKQLVKQVQSFKTNQSETDRIRSRMLRKVGSIVKDSLLSGKINIVGSLLGNNNSNGNGSSSKQTLVKQIDEYVHEASMGSSGDKRVAGLGGYAKRVYHQGAYLGTSGMAAKARAQTRKTFNGRWFWRMLATAIFIIGCVAFAMSFG